MVSRATDPIPQGQQRAPREQYDGLTVARFVGAVWVIVFHAWRFDDWHAPGVLGNVVENVLESATVAVTFFFALSGFVLTVSYLDDDGALSTSSRSFWRARVARVVPLHWLALLVAAPIALALWRRAGADPAAFRDVVNDGLAAFLLVQSFIPGRELAWNPPAWSIAVEVFFYALFPLVAPRLYRAASTSTTSAVLLLAGLWLLSVVPGVWCVVADPDGLGRAVTPQDHGVIGDVVKYHPLVRLPELLFGVVLGQQFRRGLRLPPAAIVAAVVALVVVAALGVPYMILHNGLLLPVFAALILGLASLPSSPAPSSPAPSSPASSSSLSSWSARALRLGVLLGNASYALYLLHVPLLWWISGVGERRTGRKILAEPGVTAAALVVCVVVAVVVFQLFEDPLRRRLRGRPPAAG